MIEKTIINVIKNKLLKKVTLIEYIKALHDLDYLVKQLQTFIDEYYDINVKNQVPNFIYNCILESTLLNIRKLYEFFFYFEIKVRKDENGRIQDKQNWKIHDDVFAEYFFPNQEDWYNLKLRNIFDYLSFNDKIDKKFDLDMRAIHFTFSKKNNWNDIRPIIPELIKIYDVFKEHNIFDINKRKIPIEFEHSLNYLISNNYSTSDKSKNENTNNDESIKKLIENIYDIQTIQKGINERYEI